MKEFGLFDHDFKGKGMKFCYHDPNSLPFLIQGILSLVDGISPTHFAPGGGGGGVTQGVVGYSNCLAH